MKLPHSFRWPLWWRTFCELHHGTIILVCKAKPKTSTECSRECIDCKTKGNFPIYQQYSSHNYVSVLNMFCSVKEFSLSWDPIFRWLPWQRGDHLPRFLFRLRVVFLASMGWKQHLSTGYNGMWYFCSMMCGKCAHEKPVKTLVI